MKLNTPPALRATSSKGGQSARTKIQATVKSPLRNL
jgi:hypothetical protein